MVEWVTGLEPDEAPVGSFVQSLRLQGSPHDIEFGAGHLLGVRLEPVAGDRQGEAAAGEVTAKILDLPVGHRVHLAEGAGQ